MDTAKAGLQPLIVLQFFSGNLVDRQTLSAAAGMLQLSIEAYDW